MAVRSHALAIVAAVLSLAPAAAAEPSDAASRDAAVRDTAAVIDQYVRMGLASNLALQAQTLDVERSRAALAAARARFWPEAGFATRYLRSDGGRTIDVPLGDLLNPVFTTLNELLAQQGRPPAFGPVDIEPFRFLREREHDTRLTLRQPLYAAAIPAAVDAQNALLAAADAQRNALARQLKRDIATAYLNWLRLSDQVAIVEASRALLAENLRINESLFRNGKVTEDRVLRARAEMLAVEQQLADTRNGVRRAASYVNFLLNRPLTAPLERSAPGATIARAMVDLAALQEEALA
ncbi:MAG: TolC family protein, partial [Steroidobacteraceae bacterium]|nr:TolC family protein [Steroidobacteraceae bacterium]MDW8258746.1 TolC family protein [Gammaproteobacteria bacterium]